MIRETIMGEPVDFPTWLTEQMTLHHYNQSRLAGELGVAQSTISLWLRNKSTPSIENIVALADIYKYDKLALMEMVGLVESREPIVPTGEEMQLVDRLKMLRGEHEHHALIQLFISMTDLVLEAKDSTTEEAEEARPRDLLPNLRGNRQ